MIKEVEFKVPDDEQLELTPPSANPEPPELVAEYYDLVDQITRQNLDGEVDSTKVLELHRIIVNLSKYDGSMALIFKIREAEAEGKSDEELKRIVAEHYGSDRLRKQNSPCHAACQNTYMDDLRNAWEERSDAMEDGTIRGVAAGGIAAFFTTPIGALGTAAAWLLIEDFIADRNYHEAVDDATGIWKDCLSKCPVKPG